MIANEQTRKGANMKTIAIISQKGGAGKTTISTHLAVSAERRGLQTALFDLDPQASAASWSDKRESDTPAVVSAQAARLPALLKQAEAQAADLVIIDSAPNADSASLEAARAADIILIPCRPAAFDLQAIGTTLSLAAVAKKPAYVLLNAVPVQGRVGEEARQALIGGGVAVAGPLIHQLVAFSHSVNDGRTAQEFDPKSRAAAEIEALFDWLADTLKIENRKRANTQTRKHA
jgi:chromosome partitioning protein